MIGKECPSKLSTYIAQAAQEHSLTIWHGVLRCLRDDGLTYTFPFNTIISRNLVKNRFKTFNTSFKETCRTQSRMFVPDIHIQRRELHQLILSKLLPAYKSFLKKHGSHTQSKRYNESYIKYLSDDIEKRVKSCFQHVADYPLWRLL
ncbi:hypothetical protein POM88_033981 [Heracleum sosnowskyi]|uniref:Exocyst subunit Exo70 family protein n=1 Tax=Heracleum sosnowskyi TaxID=360622 RepID=A0AAD8HKE5_9APIA|nr:hypothetical protein POM88_033981 [Heracleum sosnowskyi]